MEASEGVQEPVEPKAPRPSSMLWVEQLRKYVGSGEGLFLVLERQPKKHFHEESARFYAAEVVLALEYLHCMGVVYRDLKPENILVTESGHVQLTDFDLSFLTSPRVQIIPPVQPRKKKKRKSKLDVGGPLMFAEPVTPSNSFVGTEEYIAPEIISGQGHSAAVDWWALGILLYEMLFGRTPFRGKNRQKTFANVLEKDLSFPSNIPKPSENSAGTKVQRLAIFRFLKKQAEVLLNADDLDTLWVWLRDNCSIDEASGTEKIGPKWSRLREVISLCFSMTSTMRFANSQQTQIPMYKSAAHLLDRLVKVSTIDVQCNTEDCWKKCEF